MKEALSIKGGSDFIRVIINNQPFPNAEIPWDESWLDTTISVQLGAFSGTFFANLQTWDFQKLLNEFIELHKNLNHCFTYEATEQQLSFNCKGDGIGHIGLNGSVMDQCGIGNELSFKIELDQSCLPDIIRQLEYISKVYPSKP
jgi:hypothetical protein